MVGYGHFNKSEMALFSECTDRYAQKLLDTADIVREAMFRQQSQPTVLGWYLSQQFGLGILGRDRSAMWQCDSILQEQGFVD